MDSKTAYSTATTRSLEETRKRVESKAGLEGFRVLTVHDLGAGLQAQGFSAEPTLIIELCDADLASESLRRNPMAALLMPCKIVVQEKDGQVTLSTLLPEALAEGDALKELARKISKRLISLVDTAAATPSCCRI